jgi:hypothetical protein
MAYAVSAIRARASAATITSASPSGTEARNAHW